MKTEAFITTKSATENNSASLKERAARPIGAQRLSVDRLKRWRSLEYGLFIHYGLTTFSPKDKSTGMNEGTQPIELFNPTNQDVEQWVKVAADAGMKYIVLSAKHCSGFCIWPTKRSDYHVGNSPVKNDIVGEFVNACHKHNIKPAFYYNGDNHMLVEEQVKAPESSDCFSTQKYIDFCMLQLEELLTQYGEIEEIWFDGPYQYGPSGRRQIYSQCASLQPEMVINFSSMWKASDAVPEMRDWAWPSDVIGIESGTPPLYGWDSAWREIKKDPLGNEIDEALDYYIPVECSCMAHTFMEKAWWWHKDTKALPIAEILGKRLLCMSRNANLVLNVTPDTRGLIPDDQAKALRDVREIVESLPQDKMPINET